MTTTAKGDLSVTHASQGSWYHGFTQAASTKYWAAIARISLGIVFLWAFLDKNFGLGFTTPSEEAWNFALGDGSPTWGYLTFGINPEGQLASFFNTLGESAGVLGEQGPTLYPGSWVNWLFMLGLLGIGVALLLGVFMRIGSISGVVMLLMMYLAAAPWAQYANEAGEKQSHNPIVDDHLVYAIVLVVLMLFTAERTWGLGKWWQSTSIVQRFPWLA